MTKTLHDTDEVLNFIYDVSGFLIPVNQEAIDFCSDLVPHQKVHLKDISNRDMKFLSGYFKLLSDIYRLMPLDFKEQCPQGEFYLVLKVLQGKLEYHTIQAGTISIPVVNYTSISFKNMTQTKFETYVKEQLVIIYGLIGEYFDGKAYDKVIETIELQYSKFLTKLYSTL